MKLQILAHNLKTMALYYNVLGFIIDVLSCVSHCCLCLSTDQLTIEVMPKVVVAGQGNPAVFVAVASGISTSNNSFKYQWRKRDSNSLPSKVLGVNEQNLTIPNVTSSDEGQYYCTVTNEWDSSVDSNDVTLSIFGMLDFCSLELL